MSNQPSSQALDLSRYFSAIHRGGDGIWHVAGSQPVSYSEGGHDRCFSVEDGSFWFRHRNACILELIKACPPADGGPVFDVGGGNGYVAKGISDGGYPTVLIEPGRGGSFNAKQRGLADVVCATLDGAGLRAGSLPAVGIFDVLEHIEDDAGFLRQLHAALAPGGRLYLTVPAYQLLWSNSDDFAGHKRRYRLGQLTALLAANGFQVEYGSYFFRPLVLPVFIFRTLPSWLGLVRKDVDAERVTKDHSSQQGLLKRMLRRLHGGEIGNVRAGIRMRFGASCIVAATRRD